jgi:hypothetical protein
MFVKTPRWQAIDFMDTRLSGGQVSRQGLPPGGLKARAQACRWIMFAVTELEQPLWGATGHIFLYLEPLPQDIVLAREEFVAMMAILDSEPANALALPSKLVELDPILPPI